MSHHTDPRRSDGPADRVGPPHRGPEPLGAGSLRWRPIAVGFVTGTILALVLVVATTRTAEVPPLEAHGHGYVSHFSPPRTGFEVLLLRGDGQAYASVVLDPGLQRPEAWDEGAAAEAFFAQRPVFSYVAWVLSAGNPDWLSTAFIGLSALAGGLLVGATVAVLQARGRGQNVRFAPVVLIVPTVVVALVAFGPDVLAVGLSVTGFALWRASPSRKGWAIVVFALAVLSRESALVVPAVLVVFDAVHRRLRPRDVLAVVVPAGAYVVWLAFVRHQLGSAPEKAARLSRAFSVPFDGLVSAAPQWAATDVVAILALFVGLVVTLVLRRREVEAWVIGAYLLCATVLSVAVWQSWLDVGRMMVPAVAFAWILWVPRSAAVPAPGATRDPRVVPCAEVGAAEPSSRPGSGDGLPFCRPDL